MKLGRYFSAFAIFFALVAEAGKPEIGKPVWLVPPSVEKPFPALNDVVARRSNNNLSIAYHDGRLYFAFRSATHHHPKPPMWVWGKPGYEKWEDARSRLYVLSAPVTRDNLRNWEKTAHNLRWSLEFEVTKLSGLDANDDYREPLFLELNGHLHFYFGHVLGRPMQSKVLGVYHTERNGQGVWSKPAAMTKSGEMHWDVATRREGDRDAAYMTSYLGNAYDTSGKEPSFRVYLRRSTDGVRWTTVGEKGYVANGGVSEAALAFLPKTGELWSMLREEDGDQRGWGSLVAVASKDALGDWEMPRMADPRRYDSPRMFVEGDEIYLVARQNLIPRKDGSLDEATNSPFDLAFLGRAFDEGEKLRDANLKKIRDGKASFNSMNFFNPGFTFQYVKAYHFEQVKRTALYRIDMKTRMPVLVAQLPSAGDTAFPSVVPLGNGEYLVANYSSPFEEKKWTWNDGQNNATGIYGVVVRFR